MAQRSGSPSNLRWLNVARPRGVRPWPDLNSMNIQIEFDRGAFFPGEFDLIHPQQSRLAERLTPSLGYTRSLLALGDNYAQRAFEDFPGISQVYIVFLPRLDSDSEISRFRIVVVKDENKSGVHHRYETGWEGHACMESTTQTICPRITTYHFPDVQRQQQSVDEPRPPKACQGYFFEKLAYDYPTLKLHHKMFKFMLSSPLEDLHSLAARSCWLAFELVGEISRCEPLHSVECQIWAPPSKNKKENHQNYSPAAFDRDGFRTVGPGVTFRMSKHEYEDLQYTFSEKTRKQSSKTMAYVALGSNVGDRMAMIERACQTMDELEIRILRTSALYETEPMYVKDQQPFINGVCEVSISPSLPPPYFVRRRLTLGR